MRGNAALLIMTTLQGRKMEVYWARSEQLRKRVNGQLCLWELWPFCLWEQGACPGSWAFDWRNSTCQPFLTLSWQFWQITQSSDKSLLSKTEEKTQISGQTQIIWVGWGLWLKRALKLRCRILLWWQVWNFPPPSMGYEIEKDCG